MTGISFYDAYFPTIINALSSLEAILTKAEAHARENGIDVNTEYAPAKLYEDMLPLTFQIRVTCTDLKKRINKLTGAATEEWKDEEKTFEHLFALIKKAQELVKSVKPEDINGKELQEIEFPLGPTSTKKMLAKDCVTGAILPNLFFHVQTAYSILRMKGVPLGKMDYLAPFLKV